MSRENFQPLIPPEKVVYPEGISGDTYSPGIWFKGLFLEWGAILSFFGAVWLLSFRAKGRGKGGGT